MVTTCGPEQGGGAAKVAGKMATTARKALKCFFNATNGGISVYDIVGATSVDADVLSGKAEEDRRRAEKGKAVVVDEEFEEAERMSTDTAYSCDQRQQAAGTARPGMKARMRKIAALLMDCTPTIDEALDVVAQSPATKSEEHAATSAAGHSLPHGSAASLHARRASASSNSSCADMELAVFGCGNSHSGSSEFGAPSGYGGYRGNSSVGAWGQGEAAGNSGSSGGSSWADAGPSSANSYSRHA